MSDVWKDWEGQVADHKYQLRQFLGSTDHSVVFLTEFHDPEPRKAAIKFVAADAPNTEQQLAAWKGAAQLTHPGLLEIYGSGRCKIAGTDLLYVAMEYADENLAQILPQRALTRDEASDVLSAVVDVLVFLHEKNLTHGHMKPSNILAAGDRLKVSSDTIQMAGEAREMNRKRSAYDAPEVPASSYTPAADVWSLGVVLVEALTQQPAILPFNEKADPVIPPSLPEPFFGIAEYALRRKPGARPTSTQIAERLSPATAMPKPAAPETKPATSESKPAPAPASKTTVEPKAPAAVELKAAAAAATASTPSPSAIASASASPAPPTAAVPMPMPAPATLAVSPLDVPLSKEPAVPLEKLPRPSSQYPPVSRPPVRSSTLGPPRPVVLPNYVLPLFAAILVLVVIFALPKILRRSTEAPPTTATTSTSTSAPVPTTSVPNDRATSSPSPAKTPAAKHPAPSTPAPANAGNSEPRSTPPAATASSATSPEFKTSRSELGRGEPLDQLLPEAPAKALSTIQGTVRVVVKANVDASGRVSEAVLDTPGPSHYFADRALQAAQKWEFSSPVVDGHSVPSEWLIRFEFTRDGVHAYPSQTKP